VTEPVRKPVITPRPEPVVQSVEEPGEQEEQKPEVRSAMKVAMKSAMRPLQQPHTRPVRRTITVEPEPEPVVPQRRPVVHEPVREQVPAVEEELPVSKPQFCHNCGKKLPHAANFCPGCGTRLSQSRTLPQNRHHSTTTDRRETSRTDPLANEHRVPHEADHDEDEGGEIPIPAKPPIKKAPKGSEMTILHKFLRR